MPESNQDIRSITEVLKESISQSELSYNKLEEKTGVVRQSLMKFMANESGLQLTAADKLAKFFKLELVPVKRRSRKGK